MMDDTRQSNDALLEGSKRNFDAAVAATDAATASRLRAARERALARAKTRAWLIPPRVWVPAAAVAGLAALVLVPRIDSGDASAGRDFGTVAAADLAILLGEEELEMLAELEFYEWLELQEGQPTAAEVEDGVG